MERESEVSILGNGREREFPLTPDTQCHDTRFIYVASYWDPRLWCLGLPRWWKKIPFTWPKKDKVKLFTVRRQHRGGKHQEVLFSLNFSSLWKQNSPTVFYVLFPRCTTSALTSKEARWASCVQSPGTTSTSGFCQLRWRFFLVKLGLWSPYGTCSMLIKKTFGNVSTQRLNFRSTIFVPSPDKPRRYAQPWSPLEQVEIGTIFMFRSRFNKT